MDISNMTLNPKPPGLGEQVPNFDANTQLGRVNFYDYITGHWTLFFSHPADYTPVCTTELGTVAKLKPEFDARNCKVLGLSVDSVERHEGWIKDVNETQGTEVNFPIIADEKGEIANLVSA